MSSTNTTTTTTTATAPALRIPRNNEIVVNDEKDFIAARDEIIKSNRPTKLEELKELAKKNNAKNSEVDEPSIVDKMFSTIKSAEAICRNPAPPPPELIKGILYEGCKMSLNASSKSYKTWHLINLGMCASEGWAWLGNQTSKCKVLFMNFELPKYVIDARIKKVKDNQAPNATMQNFHVMYMRELGLSSASVLNAIDDLAKMIKEQGYKMVIIDPIYKLYGDALDENKAGDVAKLLNGLERLCNKSGASLIYSHHYAKGGQAGKDSIDRASGSGVFARDPDAIVNITALDDNDENTSFRVDMQLRAFKPVKPFGIRTNDGMITLDTSLMLDKIKRPGTYKQVYTQDDILSVMEGNQYKATELKNAVMADTGMSESKFYALWNKVKELKTVSHDSLDRWEYHPPTTTSTGTSK